MHCAVLRRPHRGVLAEQAGVGSASVDLDSGPGPLSTTPPSSRWTTLPGPSPRPATPPRRRLSRIRSGAHRPREARHWPTRREHRFTTAELEFGGMHCSACATRIQRSLTRLPAVASASVNLATDRAFVSYDPARMTPRTSAERVSERRLHRRPGGGLADETSRPRDPDRLGPPRRPLLAAGDRRPGGRPLRAGVGPPAGPC